MEILNGLHINRDIRSTCISEPSFYTKNGKLKFDSVFSARHAVFNISQQKKITLSASELFLMSVLETALLFIAKKYVEHNSLYFENLIKLINSNVSLKNAMREYLKIFPSNSIFENKEGISYYINQNNILEIFLEMLQLSASEKNPAYSKNKIIFNNQLKDIKYYSEIVEKGENLIKDSPKDIELDINLYEIYTCAYEKYSDSIKDQLKYLLERFPFLEKELGKIINLAIDSWEEEFKPIFFGPGESKAPSYDDDIYLMGAESYTRDVKWMPNVVMIAKNTLVWLDQLSKKYEREINTLDKIPEEEFSAFADWGINALWLIGLWERGEASQKIKQWTGNPEAESSAYSLKYYGISEKLGGQKSFESLKEKARLYGIKLCADMVPNHTAIDSPYVFEHNDYYLQLDFCPYPNYSFSGESVSGSDKFGVFVEDHYFDRTDASLVFKYVNYGTGEVKYIYHGNDGTNMPWNDTAQLDYLKPQVREFVKQEILNMAKDFNIIRFDAAMTLTKKHFHRLWYPEPGNGGDIPTRSAYGLSKEKFDELFPNEFWREVVDMIQEKAPNTLLLAEAFWLLEGYFVRTLGMHRVYNSAFMNMLRDEENQKYRDSIKMTLEFDREILKRYVNFMSNPDEKTAIEQFGDGDKYFGICMLMATLPGLPMFAHGQLEGYREKYGMEYSKAYMNESPNYYLFERHRKEVFPVLKKRHIFSEIENFRLYDFITDYGVDENVIVYTNRNKKEKGLFIYNNVYKETKGYIKQSVPYKDKLAGKNLTDNIMSALGILNSSMCYLIYKDKTLGLEYIKSAKEIYENGFYFELKAYEYHLLTDFKVVSDDVWGHYGKLWDKLKGKGVPNIKEEYDTIVLGPLHKELRKIINKEIFDDLWEAYKSCEKDDLKLYYFFEKVSDALKTAKDYAGGYENSLDITENIYKDYRRIMRTKWSHHISDVITEKGAFYALIMWMFIRHFGEMKYGIEDSVLSAELVREWRLKDYILNVLPEEEYSCTKEGVLEIIVQIIKTQNWLDSVFNKDQTLKEAILDYIMLDSTNEVIKVNRFDNIMWFNKECALMLVEIMKLAGFVIRNDTPKNKIFNVRFINKISNDITDACVKSEYKLDNLLKLIK